MNMYKWIDALRSGRYTQAKRALHTDNGYCCLGVACELYQQEVGDLSVTYDEDDGYYRYDGDRSLLPSKVANWLDLTDQSGSFGNTALTTKNDCGASFEEIADIIESRPNGLFNGFSPR